MLGIKEIQEIIPHRHPFLLVDCVEELEPGVRAVGYKSLRRWRRPERSRSSPLRQTKERLHISAR